MNIRIYFVAALAILGATAQAQYLYQGVSFMKHTGMNNQDNIDLYKNRTIGGGGVYTPGAKTSTAAGEIKMTQKALSSSLDSSGIARTTFCLLPDGSLKSGYFAKFIGKAFVSSDFKFSPATVGNFTSYAGNIMRDSGLGGNITVSGQTYKKSARTQFALWNDAQRDFSYFAKSGQTLNAANHPASAVHAVGFSSLSVAALSGFHAVEFAFYVPLVGYNPSVGVTDINRDGRINHLDITGDPGNQVLVSSEAVPEPMTLGLGLAGLIGAARRRRSRRA